jgi:filamentous hemagglutinin family protein
MKRNASMVPLSHQAWSQDLNALFAADRNVNRRGKLVSKRKLIVTALALALTSQAQASPLGGQVVSGEGAITQSGTTTTIKQSSQNLSLNWQSFNIAPQETVNFQQPSASAIAVNRIFDTNGTQILGHLNANGQVYLLNPNGILFGQGAQVNVGGLVASTLDLNDASLNSNEKTFSGTGTGSIVNQGTITAANGGYVALLGNHVSNQGVITAQLGTLALAAGSAATLTFSGNSLVDMQVDQSTLNNLAENKQLIQADGGQVLMSAGAKNALLASVVNNSGVIEARTVENRDGTIILLGGMTAGTTNVSGSLDASAPNGGNGGFIETSAAHVNVADGANITTAAPDGLVGTWLIDPVDFTIAATGGDITGTTLSTNLGAGNVVIQSTSGGAGTSGDVNVNDAVSWSANKLTLNAQNDININANLNGSGTANLALEYGQGAAAAGNTSTYNINAAVNLPSGNNFSTKLGSDGSVKAYTVITSLGSAGSTTATDLQGMNGGLSANYALGSNIDATATSGWNSGAGFLPVGDATTQFTGAFEGLGHTISGLIIDRSTTSYVGLFGASTGSEFRNVGLISGSVSGNGAIGGVA